MGQLIIKIDSNVNNYKFQVTVTSPRNLGANEKLPLLEKSQNFMPTKDVWVYSIQKDRTWGIC